MRAVSVSATSITTSSSSFANARSYACVSAPVSTGFALSTITARTRSSPACSISAGKMFGG